MSGDKRLIVVLGPTAVGKTATCIALAHFFKTEIVSADSRQFYRELEVGTAKPSSEELKAIPHHFINSHSILEDISAGRYEKMALQKLDELFESCNQVLLTGGSGLYIQAVTEGMADIPAIDPTVREALNYRLAQEGLERLVAQLKELDPVYSDQVDVHNPHRVIRALEICLGTGKPYSAYRNTTGRERNFQIIKIGLNRSRQELYTRIDERMDIMIEEGLFEEAQKMYRFKEHNALQTVGYKEIFDYMDGRYDRAEAIRLLKRNSRRYAKRQLTWFNRDSTIQWFHPDELDRIISYIEGVT